MSKENRYARQQTSNIKCRILSEGLYQYEAEGLCHEVVNITIEQDFRDKNSVKLKKGDWYRLNGDITITDDEVDIKISSYNEIEHIGEKVNDWLGQINKMSLEKNPGGPVPKPHTRAGGEVKMFRTMSHNMASADLSTQKLRDVNQVSTEQDITGFATGGNKDVNNFRKNIRNGYLPNPEALTYEGLFYDYEFNISGKQKDSLFYPVYEYSHFTNPINKTSEHYLAVGLESSIDSFNRPPLDLMISVDVSGSMNSEMDNYYYDQQNRERSSDTENTKIESTIKVIKEILDGLNDEDRVGVVLYNDGSMISKPLRKTSQTDINSIKEEISNIRADGGTDISAGFEAAVEEFVNFSDIDTEGSERESRIMFLTDAMPNSGETDRSELVNMIEEARTQHKIHTTFIGIGIDANPDLIKSLSTIKGSNSYFVDNTEEFIEKVGEEFTLMTVPLVFNLRLNLEGENYNIKDVFGNPNDLDEDENSIMNVKTLFPSTGENGTKGGVILVQLEDINENSDIRISATWEDRYGNENSDVRTVNIKSTNENYFDSKSIEKAVILKTYVNILKDWTKEHREDIRSDQWEQKSIKSTVTEEYKDDIEILKDLITQRIENENMDELIKEKELVDTILNN
jgi:Ca-activated chloride channel family protein